MSFWINNRKRARTINNDPTETDQSQAMDTDINVIVAKFAVSGRVPASKDKPMGGDFTALPRDLREFIETAKDLKNQWRKLPKELQGMRLEELVLSTNEQLAAKLAPAPTPAPKEDPK